MEVDHDFDDTSWLDFRKHHKIDKKWPKTFETWNDAHARLSDSKWNLKFDKTYLICSQRLSHETSSDSWEKQKIQFKSQLFSFRIHLNLNCFGTIFVWPSNEIETYPMLDSLEQYIVNAADHDYWFTRPPRVNKYPQAHRRYKHSDALLQLDHPVQCVLPYSPRSTR